MDKYYKALYSKKEKRGGIELVSTYVSGSMKLALHTAH
jgi:hypothetical protein